MSRKPIRNNTNEANHHKVLISHSRVLIAYNTLKKATKNAINLYNEIRLHVSLDYKTPNMVYLKTA
ncbi:hypothetical protein GCM10022271_20620 [Corallibacter vietnamensis]|uniref:Transposase n=1 Tax=Corallibacter vietnamensis TaxID=904130 RepID=A0ABP7H9G4_9FLAO